MRTPRIVDAMNYIDDDLVSSAVTYQRTTRTAKLFRRRLLKACACFLAIAIVLGIGIFQWRDGNVGVPFVLTAYATSTKDDNLITTEMKQGQSVPVSAFETANGLKGIVFSYDAADSTQPVSVSVIMNGIDIEETIQEISGIDMEQGKVYLFYVIPEDGETQHTFPYTITNKSQNTVTVFTIVIKQNENSYTAKIDTVTNNERKTEP